MVLANIYAAVQQMATEWCRGNEWETSKCTCPQTPLWCYQETQWVHLCLSAMNISLNSASVFQKFFEIVCFRPILLDDIKFLFSAGKNPLKVRGKINLFISLAVMWREDFKMTSIGCLQLSEQSHSVKCEWTHMSI